MKNVYIISYIISSSFDIVLYYLSLTILRFVRYIEARTSPAEQGINAKYIGDTSSTV